jgi:dipeptidyl-peptidase 4
LDPLTRATVVVLFSLVAFPFASLPAHAQGAPEKKITVEDIFAHGPLLGHPPDQLRWSPDGKHLTYLESGELLEVDSATGKTHVMVNRSKMTPLNEPGGTEEERDHRNRYHMASYLWSPDAKNLLFDSNGRLWYYDLKTGTGVQIADSGEAAGDDPKFSPDGKSVSFLHDRGIFIVHLQDPIHGLMLGAITDQSRQNLNNGGVDWVYEEELSTRSNYFWSPDSTHIAYLQMDETNVPQYPLTDWIPTHATVEMQRYPQPGDLNPDVHLGVVSVHGGRTDWIKVPLRPGEDYIPRFGWVDKKTLWIELLTRDHKHRGLFFADLGDDIARPMLEISDDKFLDENYDVEVQDGFIVLTSWSSGHNHIYLYSYNPDHPMSGPAHLQRQLTSGDFDVADVYRLDTKNKLVDYASNEGNPLEQQIWQVSFDGARTQLSSGPGFHTAHFAPEGTAFDEKSSTRMSSPELSLCTSPGKCTVFWQSRALDAYHFHPPQQLQVKANDGTTLYATLLLPEGQAAKASVPVIMNPYGGPGPQTVANRWSDALLFDELLAQHGFAVLHADNRGTGNRGRTFAQFAYHDFGPIQLQDQLTVLDDALAKFPQLDPKRLGWWGWSWGGSFTLYAMTHSDRFRAGVAVAPVTNWRNYDSIYTERYMGLPTADEKTYRDDSVVNAAANLKGHLLLAHGTGDDNVHIENTVQFIQQLIQAQIPYDLQLYPRKTHSIAGPDVRTHLYNRILTHFERYLMPPVSAAQ